MAKETSNGRSYGDERPPSLRYEANLANPQELAEIIKQLQQMERQTMNFRTMPSAQAILLKDVENGGKVIGWQGFCLSDEPGLGEKFSLHLDPKYRAFTLGLALETILYQYLNSLDIVSVMLRMDSSGNSSLIDWRLKTGILNEVPPVHLPKSWVDQCYNCELHQKSCQTQAFFKVDVVKGLAFGRQRLEIQPFQRFPLMLELKESRLRAEKRYLPKWAA